MPPTRPMCVRLGCGSDTRGRPPSAPGAARCSSERHRGASSMPEIHMAHSCEPMSVAAPGAFPMVAAVRLRADHFPAVAANGVRASVCRCLGYRASIISLRPSAMRASLSTPRHGLRNQGVGQREAKARSRRRSRRSESAAGVASVARGAQQFRLLLERRVALLRGAKMVLLRCCCALLQSCCSVVALVANPVVARLLQGMICNSCCKAVARLLRLLRGVSDWP
jgi:hypothetical protein